jgi:hypothetical protein
MCCSRALRFVVKAATTIASRCNYRRLMVAASACTLAGCGGGPSRVNAPSVDPAAASAEAIRLYDKDGDAMLSEVELAACPGILMHRSTYDVDGDGMVSQQEIEARVSQLVSARVGQTKLQIRVDWNGRPLPGASIKMIPEPYLGEYVKAAGGTTGDAGVTVMQIPDEDLPESERGIQGVHVGTFKLEVTHPSVSIPAKYNTQTTLGYETELGNPGFVVQLKK